jgi:hypothetical protein
MTKMIHSIAGRTKALTNVMAIEAKRSTVATTRTGLNIVLSCFEKPTRKPVPTSERMPPTAKSAEYVSSFSCRGWQCYDQLTCEGSSRPEEEEDCSKQ